MEHTYNGAAQSDAVTRSDALEIPVRDTEKIIALVRSGNNITLCIHVPKLMSEPSRYSRSDAG